MLVEYPSIGPNFLSAYLATATLFHKTRLMRDIRARLSAPIQSPVSCKQTETGR